MKTIVTSGILFFQIYNRKHFDSLHSSQEIEQVSETILEKGWVEGDPLILLVVDGFGLWGR